MPDLSLGTAAVGQLREGSARADLDDESPVRTNCTVGDPGYPITSHLSRNRDGFSGSVSALRRTTCITSCCSFFHALVIHRATTTTGPTELLLYTALQSLISLWSLQYRATSLSTSRLSPSTPGDHVKITLHPQLHPSGLVPCSLLNLMQTSLVQSCHMPFEGVLTRCKSTISLCAKDGWLWTSNLPLGFL